MRVAVVQSNYIPWRGYFDLIAAVDRFIIYDDVSFSKGSWRNRNRLKTPNGPRWITVPVNACFGTAIDETRIDYRQPWVERHRGLLRASLETAPFFATARDLWECAVAQEPATISELNVALIRAVNGELGISTVLEYSRPLGVCGRKNQRLISVLESVGATTYVSGPSARSYLDVGLYRERGIRLEFKSYSYPEYPQQFGSFENAVSVLDLIANVGPAAPSFLRSVEENEVVAP